MYSDGNGVSQDLIQAHAWLTFSAQVGNSAATKLLPSLETRMTAEQRAEAATMAQTLIGKQKARHP
jgi:TPR repeat protein